jgi:LacI family transcriptional regulator
LLDKIRRFCDMPTMPKRRRVALMLDLQWPLKRHADIFSGTQQYAQEQGWESTIDEFVQDTLPYRGSRAVPYDGIIARATRSLAARAGRLGVPLVNVWLSSPVRDELPGVFCDFAAAGRMRAEHLLTRGFRRFAALSSRSNRAHDLEIVEFRGVVRAAGYSCTVAKVALNPANSSAQWRKTVQTISGWMDEWQFPIGVYVGADDMGRYVAQMCRKRGWHVPEDVAIISGTNEEILCEHPHPSLTSIELGFERIGYEAARLLDRLMDEKEEKGKKKRRKKANKKPSAPEHILLAPQALVVRESTDFLAVDDKVVSAALQFIAARCHLPIRPGDVAKAVAVEPRTLQRRFRKVLDQPIAAEIRRVRIERAKRELAQTDRSIAMVSREVGFGEPARMYEIFVREVGVTPSQYRKQRQAERSI